MDKPTILIGIPCDESGGYRPFDVNLADFIGYAQSASLPFTISGNAPYYGMTGVVPGARNRIVREAFRRNVDYLWFLDDDQPFHFQDLEKLFAHGKDAIVPLSPRRKAPFLPLLIDRIEDDWTAVQHWLRDYESGLIKVAGAGMAGLLVKMSVLSALGTDGWFEFVHPPTNWDDYAEDFPFYRKLGKAGFQLWCDLDVRFGHAVRSVAYLVKQHGKWMTALADSEPFVMIPQPVHPLGIADSLGLNASDSGKGHRKLVLQ